MYTSISGEDEVDAKNQKVRNYYGEGYDSEYEEAIENSECTRQ